MIPASSQPRLPLESLILDEAPGAEAAPLDVLFVGGGPAGLAGAIRLAQLVRRDEACGGALAGVEVGVLEKSSSLGEHCLSGAVVDPEAFRTLFPELSDAELPFRGSVSRERVFFLTERGKFRLPTPPTMRNGGNRVASICEIVRWLGARAEELGVNVFTGFPAAALLVDGGRVLGARTTPAGLNRDGDQGTGYMPGMDLSARVTVLAEGARGPLSQAWLEWQRVGSANPPIFALGIKELWEVPQRAGGVVHTLGWPLPRDAFGGSFIYPMGDDLVAAGLVVGLDAPYADLDVHALFQKFKRHPLPRGMLSGGELAEWGAKTIPEGGYHAIPDRLSGDGILLAGDAAGLVDVATLKGIHYAMRSGIQAAETIAAALADDDVSGTRLSSYDTALRGGLQSDPLYRNRNQRAAFKSGLLPGAIKAGFMQMTGGRFPGKRISTKSDAAVARAKRFDSAVAYDGKRSFSKADAVFRSGNVTRDDIPSHLLTGEHVPAGAGEMYAHLCPAGVYEWDGERLTVNAPNCIDCRATDVLGPRWTPREGGSGPVYKRM